MDQWRRLHDPAPEQRNDPQVHEASAQFKRFPETAFLLSHFQEQYVQRELAGGLLT